MKFPALSIPAGTIAVDDHAASLGNLQDYAQNLIHNTQMSCFIKWNAEEADAWGGPWPGDTVLCTISDARLNPYHISNPLLTVEENLRLGDIRDASSVYYFPYRLTRDIDLKMLYKGTPCSRSELTAPEISDMMAKMTAEEHAERELTLKKVRNSRYAERLAYPSVDYPFRLYMCGSDDSSYACCYAGAEEAVNALTAMAGNPSFAILEEYGLVFTN